MCTWTSDKEWPWNMIDQTKHIKNYPHHCIIPPIAILSRHSLELLSMLTVSVLNAQWFLRIQINSPCPTHLLCHHGSLDPEQLNPPSTPNMATPTLVLETVRICLFSPHSPAAQSHRKSKTPRSFLEFYPSVVMANNHGYSRSHFKCSSPWLVLPFFLTHFSLLSPAVPQVPRKLQIY